MKKLFVILVLSTISFFMHGQTTVLKNNNANNTDHTSAKNESGAKPLLTLHQYDANGKEISTEEDTPSKSSYRVSVQENQGVKKNEHAFHSQYGRKKE